MTRNNLLGKWTRGPKIVVRIANKKRISTCKSVSPTNVSFGKKFFIGINFRILPHLKCVDFVFVLPAIKELNTSIQPSNILLLIGADP